MKRKCFCSWSSGKDSCLSLYKAIKMGYSIEYLFTMMTEDKDRSRSHGICKKLLEKQAEALGIPIIFKSAAWGNYESEFLEALTFFKSHNIEYGVFGDIDLKEHLDWVERVTSKMNIKYLEPLWKMKREDVINNFLNAGFKAKIVSVKKDVLDETFLGMDLSFSIIDNFKKIGIDLAGENGEFHTFVYDGPIFKKQFDISIGKKYIKDRYCFIDLY